jgi:hypothetical protein
MKSDCQTGRVEMKREKRKFAPSSSQICFWSGKV